MEGKTEKELFIIVNGLIAFIRLKTVVLANAISPIPTKEMDSLCVIFTILLFSVLPSSPESG